jgi:hypothetical protein
MGRFLGPYWLRVEDGKLYLAFPGGSLGVQGPQSGPGPPESGLNRLLAFRRNGGAIAANAANAAKPLQDGTPDCGYCPPSPPPIAAIAAQ